jgi:hypothetical protein
MRIARFARWVALFIVAFGLGMAYATANYAQTKGLLTAIQMSLDVFKSKTATNNWFPVRFDRVGVLRHDPSRSQPGYILYTLAPDLSAHLIDTEGRERHRWTVSRDDVMPGAASEGRTFFGVLKPQVEQAHLYPNGDILLVYAQPAMGEWAGPLVKLDKNSRILWRSSVKVHHAVEVVGDRIYALTQTFEPPAEPPLVPSLAGMPYLDDKVSILDSNGKELRSHSILRAIANTKDLRLAEAVPFNDRADPLHSNSIQVLDERLAGFIPGAKAGNVLVSLRHLDMLIVVDLERNSVVWALRGSWRAQHDAKLLPNGNIILFDNQGGLASHGKSRVIEIDPKTGGIVWSFDGSKDVPFDSLIRGSVQRMANGNTLISESTSGRILEIAPDGAVAWEYVHPLQDVENGQKIVASLGLGVIRYDPSHVSFLGERERAPTN